MPQTADTGNSAPPSDTYNVYADNFDLSLLPTTDGEVPLSPHSQLLTLELPSAATLTDYIPTTVFQDFSIKTEVISIDDYQSSDLLMIPTTHLSAPQKPQPLQPQLQQHSHYYSAPHLSPPSEPLATITVLPPSPAPSHESHAGVGPTRPIKQEFYTNHLYPPSPPDSYASSLSPRYYSDKGEANEPTAVGSDTESCIDIDTLLQQADFASLSNDTTIEPTDHQLLRGYLQDTTFQRKHNLKPLAIESLLMGGWAAGDDIGPVISLALEHARKDVQQTCAALHISPGNNDI